MTRDEAIDAAKAYICPVKGDGNCVADRCPKFVFFEEYKMPGYASLFAGVIDGATIPAHWLCML